MTQPSLRVEGFSKRFGDIVALDGASFSASPGELLGIIGPNGAGKSTLFECVAGVLPYERGTVSRDGNPVGVAARKEALFFLPDGVQPWPDQRVGRVLEFVEGLFGSKPGARDDVINALALAPLLGKRVGALSKGQRKRVSVALALVTPLPYLLLDEPFDGLDLRQSREVELVLRAHARAGRALCLSIHQLADAARLCDRLTLLSAGRTVGEGTLDDLRSKTGLARGNVEEIFLALT